MSNVAGVNSPDALSPFAIVTDKDIDRADNDPNHIFVRPDPIPASPFYILALPLAVTGAAADNTPAARRLAVGTTPAPNGALHRSHTPASPLATLTTPGMLRVGARGATVARPSRRRSAAARSIPD
ncbi:hypothetical protein CHLRE_08g373357v5 [Chlamydomonas reinhardtii]|uniref:Uncharacterized protein n=1 Tax=Chlamydomonas reinhardtii TaxID=3055 RepID=A0A2K3DHG4_CHLRE|nr:uncharacterized protein CHLRE_08g373357v5 [Chlamydomonas reinhardtii]PNW79964.1 hypothetical protein CHLRE_08g373357v5 [Chlamydomonas reinhardtii]